MLNFFQHPLNDAYSVWLILQKHSVFPLSLFFLQKKVTKKRHPKRITSPFRRVFQFSFCATVVKVSGALMALIG